MTEEVFKPEVENYSPEELRTNDGPSLSDINSNKKRSKKRNFNSYEKITELVQKYKNTKDDKYLIECIKALEGLINTFTLIIAPPERTQQIGYMNSYIRKFLGMFLSPEERVNCNFQTYMQAAYRIRWICRYYAYEDIYSLVVTELIKIIKSMRIITKDGTVCEAFFYIQLAIKYKMYGFVIKTAKDAMVDIAQMPSNFNNDEDENDDDLIGKLSYDSNYDKNEQELIDSIYEDFDFRIVLEDKDIFKVFSPYEKYIIYLHDYMCLSSKEILSILKHEDEETLEERLLDIKEKVKLISEENN